MEEVTEITLDAVDKFARADVSCRYCQSMFEIVVQKAWPIFKHPNYDLIVKNHPEFMRHLEVCPLAVEYVAHNIDKFFCPVCVRALLTIANRSPYNLASLHASMNLHIHEKIRASRK